jgi:hypothetical protein
VLHRWGEIVERGVVVTSGETLPQDRLQKRSDLILGARGRRCLRRGIVPGSIRSELEVLGRELDDLERAIATANDQARRPGLASCGAAAAATRPRTRSGAATGGVPFTVPGGSTVLLSGTRRFP